MSVAAEHAVRSAVGITARAPRRGLLGRPAPPLDADLASWTDSHLVRAYLDGDRAAFDVLYQRYYQQLVRLCRQRIAYVDEAEDVAQEAWIKALRYAATYDPERGALWPWLRRIGVHAVIDHAARRTGELRLDACEDTQFELADPLDPILAADNRGLLMQAMAALPARQRTAIELHYLEDLSYDRAAAFVGLTTNGFRQLLCRARRTMRGECERLGAAPGRALALLPLSGLLSRWQLRVARARARLGATELPLIGTSVGVDAFAGAVTASVIALASVALFANGSMSPGPTAARAATVGAYGVVTSAIYSPTATAASTASVTTSTGGAAARSYSVVGDVGAPGVLAAGPAAHAAAGMSHGNDDQRTVEARVAAYLPGNPGLPDQADGYLKIHCDASTRARSHTADVACGAMDVVERVVPPPDGA